MIPSSLTTLALLGAVFLSTPATTSGDTDRRIEAAFESAGGNRAELERALAEVPDEQRFAMAWLIGRMPERDRAELDAEFLLDHVDEAYKAWQNAAWRDAVPAEVFLDAILPYANVTETREAWRDPMRTLAAPMIEGIASPSAAAVRINQRLFPATGVKYSTKRRRADQSPSESIETGLASCTGLSILLIDACRSVGIPARLVGVPMWTDGSGNHSWVEIWDGTGWRFTGAAEPTGEDLDKGWFNGRARTCIEGDPKHGIFAVSWGDSPMRWPMAFDDGPPPGRAIDVTARYLAASPELPEGHGRLRVRVRRGDGRVALPVSVRTSGGEVMEAVSKDERFDANDHVEFVLPLGSQATVSAEGGSRSIRFEEDETLVTLDLAEAASPDPGPDAKASRAALNAFVRDLRRSEDGLAVPNGDYATVPLTETDARRARAIAVAHHTDVLKRTHGAAIRNGAVEIDGLSMPVWYQSYGDAAFGSRPLFISMHGGGGAPPHVNTSQWENQKRLYRPERGIYLAPRAPTDTWNLWHQGHVDRFFDRIIAGMVALEGVDPDRVYLMGYSAGGDGVYQLAPRMADRFAAAAMMAGHPNESKPDGLRNLPFAIWMGENDGAYDRNGVAKRWGESLATLAEADPGAYPHAVHIVPGKGHWMDREDAAAVPWMAERTRDLRPKRVVWLQDDVVHSRFYWLAVEAPKARARVAAVRDGQRISIEEWSPQGALRIRLDDDMLDLDQEVVVTAPGAEGGPGRELFRGRVPRTIETIVGTLLERDDPKGIFSGEVVVSPLEPASAP